MADFVDRPVKRNCKSSCKRQYAACESAMVVRLTNLKQKILTRGVLFKEDQHSRKK